MSITEKINQAISYVASHQGDERTVKNDAANLFAATYDEHMAIYDALNR